MKRAVTLFLLLALLSACGGQGAGTGEAPGGTPSEELGGATHRLLADWYGYIARCEYLYGDMLWALSYLEPFFEARSWDSLQTARAALSLAERRAALIDPPEAAQMTFEDYDRLIQSGADVGPVQIAVDSLPALKDALLLDYRLYRLRLNSPGEEFFLTYQLAGFEDWAGLMQQIYESYLQIHAIETDYVLLAVDDLDEEARFIEAITEKCPQISARRPEGVQDPEALLEALTVLNDGLDGLLNELSALVGQSQANLDRFRDALDLDPSRSAAMTGDLVELTGFPAALPYPDWWYEQEDAEFLYTWEDAEGGGKVSRLPGDALEAPPEQYSVKWPGVSSSEYQAYLNVLDGCGISAGFVSERDGTYTAFFQLPTGSFALVWEDGAASFLTLEGSVCFTPSWYAVNGL